MLNSIWDDVRHSFRYGNMITRLIFINVGVFVFVNLFRIILFLFNQGQVPQVYDDFIHFFCISSDWRFVLTHPWGFFTHMFLHVDFWHILWNMLFIYWFGRILGDLLGDRHVLPLYILGGLAGGIVYFLSAEFLPIGHLLGNYALGASAAVMAIVVGAGVTSPDYIIHLILLGPVRLKYIVGVLVFLDLIGMASYNNTGGHFAHLGGAAMGWLYVAQLRRGADWGHPVNHLFDRISRFIKGIFSNTPQPRMVYKSPKVAEKFKGGGKQADEHRLSHQEQLDAILDKIKRKGYESLTEEEKEFLFNASKK